MADEFKLQWIRYQLMRNHHPQPQSQPHKQNDKAQSTKETCKTDCMEDCDSKSSAVTLGALAAEDCGGITLPSTLEEAEAMYSVDALIKDYWRIVETQCNEVKVDYGSDLDIQQYRSGFKRYNNYNRFFNSVAGGSTTLSSSPSGCAVASNVGTGNTTPPRQSQPQSESQILKRDEHQQQELSYPPEWYVKTGWNLNNLPNIQGSLLRHITTPIDGVNVPWLYIGMLFSSFCWHTEDNHLNSINYNHHGAAKIWYGVPGASATAFEKVARANLPLSFKESPDLLHQMNTQISPGLLYT